MYNKCSSLTSRLKIMLGGLTFLINQSIFSFTISNLYSFLRPVQSPGTIEYANCISAKGLDPHPKQVSWI